MNYEGKGLSTVILVFGVLSVFVPLFAAVSLIVRVMNKDKISPAYQDNVKIGFVFSIIGLAMIVILPLLAILAGAFIPAVLKYSNMASMILAMVL